MHTSETCPLHPLSLQGERSYLGAYHFISKADHRDSRRISETIFSLILTLIHSLSFSSRVKFLRNFPQFPKKRIQNVTVGKIMDFGFSSNVDSLIYLLVTLDMWLKLFEPQIALMMILTQQIRFVCDGTGLINVSSLPLAASPLKPVLLLTHFRPCFIVGFEYTWLASLPWCKLLFKKGWCVSL